MKKTYTFPLFTFLVFFLFTGTLFAQEQDKENQKEARKEARLAKKNRPPQKGDIYLMPLPIIGVNPALGFIYGVGANASWYMGDPASTQISTALGAGMHTTFDQTIAVLKSVMYTQDNSYILLGDWRYLNSSQPTWGLGTGPQSAKLSGAGIEFEDGSVSEGIPGGQMMEFNHFRFHETVLKNLGNGFYAGLGAHVDYYYDYNDQLLNLEDTVLTSFYLYNQAYGFNQSKSTLVGVSLNGIYDTRDNQNDPYKGRYAYVSYKMNPEFLGSEKSSSTLWMEYRYYLNITPADNHNILAFWTWGNFKTTGDLPYMTLPAIGYDQFAKSGRPYAQGRFRGDNMVYAETEFRRHLFGIKKSPNLFGAVAYFNVTTASSANNIKLFEYLNKGYGVGLRIAFNEKARSNIGFDYGWGDYGTKGFYMRLNETF